MSGSLEESNNAFIGTQGPLEHTVNDFWNMIWVYDVTNIMMLCDFEDLGKIKCFKYWNQSGTLELGNGLKVECTKYKEEMDNLYEREFILIYKGRQKTIFHTHITDWDDSHAMADQKHTDYLVKKLLYTSKNKMRSN